MANINLILSEKGSQVHTISGSATVQEAAIEMNRHKVGALVVLSHDRIDGIFTERDVLRRIVAGQRNPATTLVEQVMTENVVCCHEKTTLDEARRVFKNRRIRHLPVLNEQRRLVGMISIGDLNAFKADNHEKTIHSLQAYLYERT